MEHEGTMRYGVGMYGGKFMPFHKGHLHCLEVAVSMCDKVWLALFVGGLGEELIRSEDDREMLAPEARWDAVRRVAAMYDNVTPVMVDVSRCRLENGCEDWDAETPLVLDAMGHFDAVFGSETSYAFYFERAYPWADYVVVDEKRETVPISATMVRAMEESEATKWIV